MLWRLGIILAVFILAIGSISAYLAPDDLSSCNQVEAVGKCRKAEAVVAISGGDTLARTDEAVKLFQEGWAEYVVLSGAAADKTGPSNASAMRDRALELGVAEDRIVIEEFSETTKQNAVQVGQHLESIQAYDIILVTSGYHMKRASLEFASVLSEDFSIRSHPVAEDSQWSSTWWLTPWGWWIAASELVKIGLFYVGGTR